MGRTANDMNFGLNKQVDLVVRAFASEAGEPNSSPTDVQLFAATLSSQLLSLVALVISA